MLAICTIIGVTIALSREQLLIMGFALFAAAACHNATGYLLGYWGGRLAGLNQTDARTTALEVGLQNGGMATGLAFDVLKSPAAALASAVFGPWSVVTSSALASWWRRSKTKNIELKNLK
jgi:BASS family bile acid:Na+ symporter